MSRIVVEETTRIATIDGRNMGCSFDASELQDRRELGYPVDKPKSIPVEYIEWKPHAIINPERRAKILEFVNVAETGSKLAKPDALVVLPDGAGGREQITYGMQQATEDSGSLGELLDAYCDTTDRLSFYADKFESFMPDIGTGKLAHVNEFHELLVAAARKDPVMLRTQQEFFESRFWQPAAKWAEEHGLILPLSMLVVYDSWIHSGGILRHLRSRFPESPPSSGGDEKTWVTKYVEVRHAWLSGHSDKLMRNTQYRTLGLLKEIWRFNWLLELPIEFRGIAI